MSESKPFHQFPYATFSDIHCLRSSTLRSFTAFLRPPEGFNTKPVLEERPAARTSAKCTIAETNVAGVFALDLDDLAGCGVRTCDHQDGDQWLCLLVRFPVMAGLKLPEDEVIEIKCKPQERSVEGRNVINFQKNA